MRSRLQSWGDPGESGHAVITPLFFFCPLGPDRVVGGSVSADILPTAGGPGCQGRPGGAE